MTSKSKYVLIVFILLVPKIGHSQSTITSISIDDSTQLLNPNAPIQIKALENEVLINFASTNTDTSSYYFQLKNFDYKWVKSQYPQARYTNLPGGDFQFSWRKGNEKIQTISFEVEKSLTEEWWFIPVLIFYIVLLLSAAIYFFLLYNLRQKVKIQSIRNRIASDLHDEVGSNLNSIALFTRIAEKKLDVKNIEIHALLDKIKSNSEETVSTIRDTVWAINPDNDSSENLFEKMRAMAYEVLSAKDIELNYTNEIIDHKALKMSMEQRRNIYLIFKEAINNIVKHADATEVNIKIFKEKDDIKLDIANYNTF